MASLLVDQYLNDTISRPEMYTRMIEGSLMDEYRRQAIEIYGTDSILITDY